MRKLLNNISLVVFMGGLFIFILGLSLMAAEIIIGWDIEFVIRIIMFPTIITTIISTVIMCLTRDHGEE